LINSLTDKSSSVVVIRPILTVVLIVLVSTCISNLSFLVVQPSQVNTEQSQTILPEMSTEVSARIVGFSRQVSWLFTPLFVKSGSP